MELSFKLGIGSLAALAKGVSVPLPKYPAFPSTAIAPMKEKADLYNGASAATDVAVSDSPYGISTAIQIALPATSQLVSHATVLSSGVDVSNGHISFEFKPISGLYNGGTILSSFKIRLYSSGTPASPPANYTETGNHATYINKIMTGASSAPTEGRWQNYSAPISWFSVIGGSGANLSAVKWARIEFICGTIGATIQIGYVRFFSNPLTKAQVIFRWDDAVASAYTIGKPLLDAIGKPGFLAPGAIASSAGLDQFGRMTSAQALECHNAGWQVGSQSYSTENAQPDYASYVTEFAGMMAYAKTHGWTADAVDGSFYSNVSPNNSTAAAAMRAVGVRTIQRFDNGNPTNPPNIPGETFPFGDEFNIRTLNIASPGGAGAAITTYVQYALTRCISDKGVLILGMHDDLTNADVLQAFNDVIGAYVSDPTKFDITTPNALLAPYLALYGPKTYLP